MQDTEQAILRRIRGSGKGWCFTPTDFADLGEPPAVWTALHRLTQRSIIRRLAQGLYDFPKTHAELGTLSPDPEAVARAVARGRSIRVQPAGAYAANLLGLSEQVPARIVFLTDGAPRRIRFENQEIVLRRTTPRNMETAGRISGTVIQALRYIRKERITPAHRQTLARRLNAAEKKQLFKDRLYAPDWMRRLLAEISGEGGAHA
ncbi:MAG TPA: DUF6088 family protein [Verrucomicrobiae bacterium]|nr:DUF6088 family protein [Verrucomicrobiae bacterium]